MLGAESKATYGWQLRDDLRGNMQFAFLDEWHELRYQRSWDGQELEAEALDSMIVHCGKHASLLASRGPQV